MRRASDRWRWSRVPPLLSAHANASSPPRCLHTDRAPRRVLPLRHRRARPRLHIGRRRAPHRGRRARGRGGRARAGAHGGD
ncbi:MAG: hypothetical protein M3Y05_09170, partial [Gemmatimonadota bacterium]|nr:hypothetical protein [Gemmatimonadota bacterium]